MPETALQPGFTQEAFEAFLTARRESDWLVDLRRKAFDHFLELPLPDTSQEEWRRTDLRMFRLDKFGVPGDLSPGMLVPSALLTQGVELGGETSALNSRHVQSRLDDDLARQGVLFGSLDELVEEHGELLRPHLLRRAVDPNYDKFAALHAALWSGGTLLYVPRGVRIERP